MRALSPALLLGLALACGGGGSGSGTPAPSAPPKPTISSFTATPSILTAGQSSTLAWVVTGATTVKLEGSPTTATSAPVAPAASTTYTLIAEGAGGQASASVTVTVGSQVPQYGTFHGADLGVGANLNGAIPFTTGNAWNQDISGAPVDPNSANLIATIGLNKGLHPDFGSGLYQGAPIGIPYVVVAGAQPKVTIALGAYADESDPGPYPVPPNAPIEGQMADGSSFGGDRHVLVIDRDANRLYELGNAYPQPNGSWQASGGAIFTLDGLVARPTAQPGWTSTDAAGLPIFPGLARYEEAASGAIRHALRFTVNLSRRAYVPPATHWASSSTDVNRPPMGMRVRLKASFVIPGTYTTESKALLQAMKTFGMLVADNGSDWYISGAPDPRWNNSKLLSELGAVKGSDFEVVRMDGIVTP
ncbi:MAG TPA: hypothetical protein VJ505_03360 [Holophagaceae bacterium]|nr:hypothetical protein [Holophagaceae bacterium]